MPIQMESLVPLLQVFDMPTSIRFYRDILGFEVTQTSEPGDDCDWALLENNHAEVMLNTAYERDERPAAPDPARIAAHEDTGLFIGCPDLDAAYEHLRAAGLEVKPPQTQDYGMRQLYVSDPDGYNICFQWPQEPGA
jgi:glyoxylase I family protein